MLEPREHHRAWGRGAGRGLSSPAVPSSRLLALAAVLAGLAQAACGGGGSGEKAPDTPARPAGGCQAVAPPDPRPEGDLERPAARLRRDETIVARVRTSCGT